MRLIDAWALMEYCNNLSSKTIDANDIARFPTAVGWISVKEGLPKEKPSIFNRFYGTAKWDSGMWRYNSDPVIVAVKYPDGTRRVTIGETHDGELRATRSGYIPHEVTHWMPLPEMPLEEDEHG